MVTNASSNVNKIYKKRCRANLAEEILKLSPLNGTNYLETKNQTDDAFKWFNIASVVCIAFIVVQGYSLCSFSKKVSIALHKKLLSSILYTPLTFFNSHFIANTLNRFSKDFVVVDEILQRNIHRFLMVRLFLDENFRSCNTSILGNIKFTLQCVCDCQH